MARLNEAPQPAVESVDALKRRFVRQNREIARANSTQSIRIRNLENEISRLLTENVSLREQIIKLHYEVEKNTSQSVQDNVDRVKAKLEAKLADLGGLMKELGDVHKSAEKKQTKRRSSIGRNSPKRSPDQKNWKNALTLSEATGGIDSRLPPIVEDKYYPRRTMDTEEIISVFADPANVTDSPDLGPPPVAHFDDGDPIKFDARAEMSNNRDLSERTQGSHSTLPSNLETRKKRRESSHHREIGDQNPSTRLNQELASKDPTIVPAQPLKSGAKRKLNMRDEEDQPGMLNDHEKDVSQYNRRIGDSRASESAVTKPETSRTNKSAREKVIQPTIGVVAHNRGDKAVEAPARITSSNRRALGPKSVNTDSLNSPVRKSSIGKDKVADAKDDLAKIVQQRNKLKERTQSGRPGTKVKEQGPVDVTVGARKPAEPPPETPAPLPDDLFSPNPSEPSTGRAESCDTPPPPDLGSDTGTGSFGRASRRPRGTVNYAQPNLRDKMRRPTKELVDAVGAEERLRQANLRADGGEANSVIIKQEENVDNLFVWRTNDATESHRNREEPTSPLSNKTSGSTVDLPSSIITERRRRTIFPTDACNTSDSSKHSGAASAIAALTAGNYRPKQRDEERISAATIGEDMPDEPTERPSIYDFTGSSPDPGGHSSDKDLTEKASKAMRSSRRHSSVPATSEQGPGSLSISRRGERRREPVLGGGKREESSGHEDEAHLSRTKSVLDMGAASEDVALRRGERAASRRRSMML